MIAFSIYTITMTVGLINCGSKLSLLMMVDIGIPVAQRVNELIHPKKQETQTYTITWSKNNGSHIRDFARKRVWQLRFLQSEGSDLTGSKILFIAILQ